MNEYPKLQLWLARAIPSSLAIILLAGCLQPTAPATFPPTTSPTLEFTVTPTTLPPSSTTQPTLAPTPTTQPSPSPTPQFSVSLERAIPLEQEAYDAAWSPDGQTLAVATQKGVVLFDSGTWDAFAHESMGGLVLKLDWMPGFWTETTRVTFMKGYGLYAAGADGVYFWNIGERAPPRVDHLITDSACWSLAVHDQALVISRSTVDSHKIEIKDSPYGSLPVIEGRLKPKISEDTKSELVTDLQLNRNKAMPFEVRALAYSPDGKMLAFENNLYPIIWPNIPLGSPQYHTLPPEILDLAWSPDGLKLAAGGSELAIWDINQKTLLHQFEGHTKYIWSVAWSPDGRILASGSDDQTIRLWDTTSGEELAVLKEHTAGVSGVTWAPFGLRLASVGRDKMLRIWKIDASWLAGPSQPNETIPLLAQPSGAPISQANLARVAKIARIEEVKYPLFSNDSRYVAWSSPAIQGSWGNLSSIYLMEIRSGAVYQIDGQAPITFLSDRASLITLDQGNSRLMEWNLEDGLALVKTIACGNCGNVPMIAVSPNSSAMVATNQVNGAHVVEIRRLDGNALENQVVQLLGKPIEEGQFRWAESFQFSPSGNLLAIIFNDGIVEVWRWKENRLLQKIDIDHQAQAQAAFSPDEQTLWYSYVKYHLTSMIDYGGFEEWQIDPDGGLRLGKDFHLPLEEPSYFADKLVLSPQTGQLAAIDSKGLVTLWSMNEGQKVGSLETGAGLNSLIRFSQDGSLLLTLSQEGVLELWGVPSP